MCESEESVSFIFEHHFLNYLEYSVLLDSLFLQNINYISSILIVTIINVIFLECTQLEDPRLEWRAIQEAMLRDYLHTAQDLLEVFITSFFFLILKQLFFS